MAADKIDDPSVSVTDDTSQSVKEPNERNSRQDNASPSTAPAIADQLPQPPTLTMSSAASPPSGTATDSSAEPLTDRPSPSAGSTTVATAATTATNSHVAPPASDASAGLITANIAPETAADHSSDPSATATGTEASTAAPVKDPQVGKKREREESAPASTPAPARPEKAHRGKSEPTERANKKAKTENGAASVSSSSKNHNEAVKSNANGTTNGEKKKPGRPKKGVNVTINKILPTTDGIGSRTRSRLKKSDQSQKYR